MNPTNLPKNYKSLIYNTIEAKLEAKSKSS